MKDRPLIETTAPAKRLIAKFAKASGMVKYAASARLIELGYETHVRQSPSQRPASGGESAAVSSAPGDTAAPDCR